MNDVSLHVPYIFGNKQNLKREIYRGESKEEQKAQLKIEPREAHGRPRQTRERQS